jgi:uncharacterized protein
MVEHQGLPCPVCKVDLVMSERQGIEIDYCPQCRGVWLDRGELDKIIERSVTEDAGRQRVTVPVANPDRSHSTERHGGHGSSGSRHGGRRGFLSNLFD